ncbi:hypothetical protein Q0N12_04160 [Rossellomorea marisflavi]|uniref:hypothetical protein n=1 Tax=Rossellomorea marisflavi TaxID=189381 RepID=UPI003459C91A
MAYIKCRDCGKAYEKQDEVALDELNTVLHKDCKDPRGRHLDIIDEGTFEEIVGRHFDPARL